MLKYIKLRIKGVVFGRTRLGEYVNTIYDIYLFLKFSFTSRPKSKKGYQAYLTKQYHIIEKGMSLPHPRENFGREKIQELIIKSEEYITRYGDDDLVETIRVCLSEYLKKNNTFESYDQNLFEQMKSFIGDASSNDEGTDTGGTKVMSLSDIRMSTNIDYTSFLKSRVSVRDFSEKDINFSEISEVIDIARNTPSVCNRQSWQVHYYDNRELIDEVLKIQAGSAGFTNSVKAILIVTMDIRGFTKLEHNQLFTDGGLFSMSLLLALHSKGFGACCLNTCFPFTSEISVKKRAEITESERLIMIVGIGYLKENFIVAQSKKKQISEILVRHEA